MNIQLREKIGWCTVSASNFEVSKLNLRESRAIFFIPAESLQH